jgi:hypothetical protein
VSQTEWRADASRCGQDPDGGRPLTVQDLERWVSFGAAWRLAEISDRRAVVDLCQCTGELVERRESSDPMVLEYLRNHRAADT